MFSRLLDGNVLYLNEQERHAEIQIETRFSRISNKIRDYIAIGECLRLPIGSRHRTALSFCKMVNEGTKVLLIFSFLVPIY